MDERELVQVEEQRFPTCPNLGIKEIISLKLQKSYSLHTYMNMIPGTSTLAEVGKYSVNICESTVADIIINFRLVFHTTVSYINIVVLIATSLFDAFPNIFLLHHLFHNKRSV